MPDLNMVQLMGRLTADPELRRISSGTAVTELRMAVNKKWKTKDGEAKEKVLFVGVTFWDKQAEIVCQYLHKGSNVYIQGSLELEQWNDKATGEKREKIKVAGDNFQFLDAKGSNDNGNGGGYQGRGRPEAPTAAPRSAPPAGRGGAPPARAANYTQREVDNLAIGGGDDMSDVPFARPLEFDENEFFGPSVF